MGLSPHCFDQFLRSHHIDRAFQVVCQKTQPNFRRNLLFSAAQNIVRPIVPLDRSERMLPTAHSLFQLFFIRPDLQQYLLFIVILAVKRVVEYMSDRRRVYHVLLFPRIYIRCGRSLVDASCRRFLGRFQPHQRNERRESIRHVVTASEAMAMEFAAAPIMSLIAANRIFANMPISPRIE